MGVEYDKEYVEGLLNGLPEGERAPYERLINMDGITETTLAKLRLLNEHYGKKKEKYGEIYTMLEKNDSLIRGYILSGKIGKEGCYQISPEAKTFFDDLIGKGNWKFDGTTLIVNDNDGNAIKYIKVDKPSIYGKDALDRDEFGNLTTQEVCEIRGILSKSKKIKIADTLPGTICEIEFTSEQKDRLDEILGEGNRDVKKIILASGEDDANGRLSIKTKDGIKITILINGLYIDDSRYNEL